MSLTPPNFSYVSMQVELCRTQKMRENGDRFIFHQRISFHQVVICEIPNPSSQVEKKRLLKKWPRWEQLACKWSETHLKFGRP